MTTFKLKIRRPSLLHILKLLNVRVKQDNEAMVYKSGQAPKC